MPGNVIFIIIYCRLTLCQALSLLILGTDIVPILHMKGLEITVQDPGGGTGGLLTSWPDSQPVLLSLLSGFPSACDPGCIC